MSKPPDLTKYDREVWTVSRLNREARMLVETGLRTLWLEGEISNLAEPASGHIYFSLKDDAAQVRCAMFRPRRQALRFKPADGAQVVIRGRVSLYEARGEFQVIVDLMEESGAGALQAAFEALKRKLAAEGLFDDGVKRTPPALPSRIGVVTSPSGAALRDILSVLARRFPSIPVVVYPVPVQGDGAAAKIAAAIAVANRRAETEVLIVARGGGSIEDLWAFNDEDLARAIRASCIPVVTGIGHEIDFTIADFAADRRAPTPSAAAELVVPDRSDLVRRVTQLVARLERAGPARRLQQKAQRLDELDPRLRRAMHHRIGTRRDRLATLAARLSVHSPRPRLQRASEHRGAITLRLHRAWQRTHERAAVRIAVAERALGTVGPMATLERGYAIITDARGSVVRDAATLATGDRVEARFAKGTSELEVKGG